MAYRAIDEVLADRRRGTNLSEVVENILQSPYVLEQLETPFDVIYELYPGDYVDASTIAWGQLPAELQIKYSSAYQHWYAHHFGYANVEGTFDLVPGVETQMMLIPPMKSLLGYRGPITESTPYQWRRKWQRDFLSKKPFWMGKYEVMQEEWEAVMGNNPSFFSRAEGWDGDWDGRCPVDSVRRLEAVDFCKRTKTKLPDQSKWELACRAGTTGDYSFPDIDHAFAYLWYGISPPYYTHPVGQKLSNAWGLHDMLGNVWEWTSTRYDFPKGYTLRGGSYRSSLSVCTSFVRDVADEDGRNMDIGFRVMRDI